MAEIKKHIESQMKLLATDRIKQLLERVQPDGLQTRAIVPSDCHVFPDDWKTSEEIWVDISELCNWCRLYFGEGMRPPMIKPPIKLAEAEKMDESTDDKFKELAAAQYDEMVGIVDAEDIQSALNPFKCNEDRKNCERVTWSQLNIDKPLVNNQRLQALGMIELEVGGSMLSKNPADYDYLLKDGNVVCLLPVDDRKAETPLKDEGIPWSDLDVEQAAAARNLVSKALKVNPTIRDLAMHNYTVEDGKVTGLVSVEEVVSIR